MMMPANYSAISENEMTYVNGGALADVLADKLTVENWKQFNTNMVTLIGNAFMDNYVQSTLGTIFSGSYKPGNIARGYGVTVSNIWNKSFNNYDRVTDWAKFKGGVKGVLNVGLNLVGNAAAIYNLATANVDNAVEGKKFGYVVTVDEA